MIKVLMYINSQKSVSLRPSCVTWTHACKQHCSLCIQIFREFKILFFDAFYLKAIQYSI